MVVDSYVVCCCYHCAWAVAFGLYSIYNVLSGAEINS